MTMRSGPILVVFNQFPKRSETFLCDEVMAWRSHGWDVRPVSLLPSSTDALPGEMVDLAQQTLCLRARALPELGRFLAGRSLAPRLALLRRLTRAVGGARNRHDALCCALGWAAGVALASLVRSTGAGHLHAAWGNAPAEACLHASALTSVPYTVSVHAADYWRDTPPDAPRLAAAALVLACNAELCQDLCRRAPDLGPRVALVPHGARLDRFTAVERAPGPPWRILAVGRNVSKKGLPVLVEACRRLAEAGLDFHCTIAGDGTRSRALVRQVRACRMERRVLLAGPLDHGRIAELMAGHHLLAVPSLVAPDGDRDGVPNVLVEALLRTLPVVASRCGSIPEVITPSSTGLLVEPGDPEALACALLAAIASYREALAMAARGREQMLARVQRETQGPYLERVFARLAAVP